MRVLFLGDQLQDLVSDPLYVGLVKLLGHDHVVEWPEKAIYHEPGAKRWFCPQFPRLHLNETEIRDRLAARKFDLVCVSTPRPECLAILKRLYVPGAFPPLVFVDGADDTRIRRDVIQRFPIAVYFKREYIWRDTCAIGLAWRRLRSFGMNGDLFARTFPLPISVIPDTLPTFSDLGRDVDASFVGHISHRKRAQAIQILQRLTSEGYCIVASIYGAKTDRKYKLEPSLLKRFMVKICDPSYVTEEQIRMRLESLDYYRLLSRSKIAVSVRGGGFDTYRYWEIVACKALLVSERPDIVIPNNYEHRRHAVFCKPDLSDLGALIRYYAAHEDERRSIVEEGYAHLLKYHTCERRAEYFLDICRRYV